MCIILLQSLCYIYLAELGLAIFGLIGAAFFSDLEPWSFFLWWIFTISFGIWFLAELVELTYVPTDRLKCCSFYSIAAAFIFLVSGTCEICYNYIFYTPGPSIFQVSYDYNSHDMNFINFIFINYVKNIYENIYEH